MIKALRIRFARKALKAAINEWRTYNQMPANQGWNLAVSMSLFRQVRIKEMKLNRLECQR